MNKINEIRETAENYYRQGDFYCSEAVVKSVIEGLGYEISRETVAMSSGFPVGIGGAGCTCGAIAGGIMAIGYVFGRDKAKDPSVNKAMQLSNLLYKSFIKKNRCSCCKILTKGMEKGSEEHMSQCIRFTGEMAEATYSIISENL